MRFIISPLPGIFFSNMRPRSDNPTLLLPHFFLLVQIREKPVSAVTLFIITFQLSTTAQSVQQNQSLRAMHKIISMKKTSQKRVKCLFLYLKLNMTLQIGTFTIHTDIILLHFDIFNFAWELMCAHQQITHLDTVSVIFVVG